MKEFHTAASQISKDVHHTSQKLSKLTKLVQHRSLFNDPAEEINNLVHSIKEDLTHLNSQLEAAQVYANNNKQRLGQKNQAALHSVNVVNTLKIEASNAAQSFKKILQQRSDNMRAQQTRKDVFGSSKTPAVALGKPAVYKPVHLNKTSTGSPYQVDKGKSPLLPRPGNVTSLPEGEMDGVTAPLLGGQMGSNAAQQQLIPDQTYFEERATVMTQVESQILELGTIFNKLGLMVQEQRDLVERLEDNVEDTHQNVSMAQLALLNVYNNLRSNRALALKIFTILVVFFTLFII
eukprot:CAMPEP_0117742632 /NCGR_PEP_ID=MMETSP0947-20121206/5657_1 /TAXON_ID=44440 /ORGANISM="Chattonella subsalsa, Strain CCMP2191" /LENGTH=291 /DNA_ID=CAMNT_0005559183 /DNA_START=182 /DNA_END=1054 /DNA_ORIENTATION=+